MPCKNFFETGECKFGDGCSFFHSEKEKRHLIDPLPSLPEGATLPPMPEKLKNYKQKKAERDGEQPSYYNTPQPMPQLIQLNSLTDIMALGGFNPNKYMTPPQPYYGYGYPGYGTLPPHLMHQQMQHSHYGNPQPFNGQVPPSPTKVAKHNDKKGDKKGDKKANPKANGEKKYVTKSSPNKPATETK